MQLNLSNKLTFLKETGVWSNFYSEGFFGYGEKGDFKLGSMAHIMPILLFIIVVILIYKYKEQIKKSKYQENIQYILIALMFFSEISFWCRLVYVGPGEVGVNTMLNKMPLQVCQWTLIITMFALITKSKLLFNMGFYLTSLPSFLAILIVEVISTSGPTYFRYYQFWFEHLIPMISIYYMFFILDYKPKLKYVIHTMSFLSLMYYISSYADAFVPEGMNKYMYKNFINKIPFFKNANNLEIYFILLSSFSLFFIFYYFIFQMAAKYKNKKDNLLK